MGRFLTTKANGLPLPPKITNHHSNPNRFSLKQQCLSLISSCSSMARLFQIQSRIQTSGLGRDDFLLSEMLYFCAFSPSGDLRYARFLLARSPNAIRASWNHVIRGFVQNDSPDEAIEVFVEMRGRGMRANEITYPFVIKACAQLSALQIGRQVHADAMKTGFDSLVYLHNTLMHLYGSCKKIDEAWKVFNAMSLRTVVSWNTLLAVCIDNLVPEESIELFVQMRSSGLEPDQTTFVVLLSASAELGSLSLGRWIHSEIVRKDLEINLQLGTALADMYAKCGVICYADRVFRRMTTRNVWTWSTIILGHAQHGSAERALKLFYEMKSSLIKPNHVTYLGVLCACSHAGFVSDGHRFFREMVQEHGIKPTMAHYSTMVDILGRRGHLVEAYYFIRTMPVKADAVVWRTLLSACQLHSTTDTNRIGEKARRSLLEMEPRRSGNFVMVANMYSEVGSWEKAANVRQTMREEGLKKMAGESCIDLGGSIHRFVSGEDSGVVISNCVYDLLDSLNLNMRTISHGDVKLINCDSNLPQDSTI